MTLVTCRVHHPMLRQ